MKYFLLIPIIGASTQFVNDKDSVERKNSLHGFCAVCRKNSYAATRSGSKERMRSMDKRRSVPFYDVTLTEGFWKDRQMLNEQSTIPLVYRHYRENGRIAAFHCDWKEGQPHRPHIFWDSDVAKWMEAAAYALEHKPAPELEQAVDEVVDLIAANQRKDGYYNSYFISVEPAKRFSIRGWHELYCAGHLIEASVAYAHATGKTKFLELMCKYADCIDRVFRQEQSAAFHTPGHEEIELALVKLYRFTGEKRYLELSKYFVDRRGQRSEYAGEQSCPSKDGAAGGEVWEEKHERSIQSHVPVREMETAEGHAVRAGYLYSAMADLAGEYQDEELFSACRKIFDNIVQKRMYITGGVGSSRVVEAFTIDYDLPNMTAYTESCAAIALAFFANRMSELEADGIYADTVERVMYNGFLSSTSLDGKAFFYQNPLEVDPRLHHRDPSSHEVTIEYPAMQRSEELACSCCPPNIVRFMESLGNLLYTAGEDILFINQFVPSKTKTKVGDQSVGIQQATRYPLDGRIDITLTGMSGLRCAVRIPGWCRGYRLEMDGNPVTAPVDKGYVYLMVESDRLDLSLCMDMEPQLMEASPFVQENAGRVAVQRGPVIYCLEGQDNGCCLRDVAVSKQLNAEEELCQKVGIPSLKVDGYRRDPQRFHALYQPMDDAAWIKQRLTMIPYFSFANRGEDEMIVWVQVR